MRITSAATVDSHVNGRPVGGRIRGARTIVVGVPGHRLRSLSLTGGVRLAAGHGRMLELALRGARAARGKLAVKLAGS